MKIGLQTWGTDGDFLPFLALAIGLKNAGHEVTLAYTSIDGKTYADRDDVKGINLICAKADDAILQNHNPYALNAKAGSFREYSKLLAQYFDPNSEAMYETSKNLCRHNDLVIGHAVCHTLLTASQKFNCPRVSLVLTPLVVRSNYVSPVGVQLGSFIHSFMWNIGGKVATSTWFKAASKIRKREGLPPVKSLQKELFTSELLTLVAASQALTPKPKDWPNTIEMTGFLNLPVTHSERPIAKEVKAFIDAGEPPIYMTFGSCMQFDLIASTNLLIKAAQLYGKRVIIQSDWSKVEPPANPNILCITQIEHARIFPLCSLIVHHGGAGTTQAALLAGKPSVVIAHGFDQPYWGNQLKRAGVGANVLDKANVSPQKIANEVSQLLDSNATELAKQLGSKLVLEKGVLNAIEHIQSLTRER